MPNCSASECAHASSCSKKHEINSVYKCNLSKKKEYRVRSSMIHSIYFCYETAVDILYCLTNYFRLCVCLFFCACDHRSTNQHIYNENLCSQIKTYRETIYEKVIEEKNILFTIFWRFFSLQRGTISFSEILR